MWWVFVPMQECANEHCDTMVSDPHPTGFCSGCEDKINSLVARWDREIQVGLDLEAQFFQYCKQQGLPSPHDP